MIHPCASVWLLGAADNDRRVLNLDYDKDDQIQIRGQDDKKAGIRWERNQLFRDKESFRETSSARSPQLFLSTSPSSFL